MRKINSNDYGGKVILLGFVFLLILPIVLNFLYHMIAAPVIQIMMYVSVFIGAIIEACIGLIIILELRQDRKINQYYEDNPSSMKTPQQIIDDSRWKKYHRKE